MTPPAADTRGILRLADDVLVAWGRPDAVVLLLPLATNRYARVPARSMPLLTALAGADAGLSVHEVARCFPAARWHRLTELGVLVHIPPEGRPVQAALVAELLWRNAAAQWRLRRRPQALMRLVAPSLMAGPVVRPLLFDDVEAAARVALSMPGTSAVCTAVSLSIAGLLTSRGYPARVELQAEPEQVMAHAAAVVGRHRVEPGTSDLALAPMRPLRPSPAGSPCGSCSDGGAENR